MKTQVKTIKANKVQPLPLNQYQGYVKKALEVGGFLRCGRLSWSIHFFEHQNEGSSATTSGWVSGSYDLNNNHFIIDLAFKLGLPIIDNREATIDEAFKFLRLPNISREDQRLSSGALDSASLKTFKALAEENNYSGMKFYNIR